MKPTITEIQVVPIRPKSGLVGFASFVLNGWFYLGNIGIMSRIGGGYRLTYPTKDSYSLFFPLNKKVAEEVEDKVISKFEEAKTEVDKNWTNAKFIAKPEAYLLKASIYAGLAMTEAKKSTPEAEQLIATADEAYTKYKSMEPELGLTSDLVYQNSHVNLYSYYYTAGYQD